MILHECGGLCASTRTRHWLPVTASERITTNPPSFAWDARITLPPGLRLCVHDEYAAGVGAGRVILPGLPLSGERARPELDAGALHRYLAESLWYPTALLPRGGLERTQRSRFGELAVRLGAAIRLILCEAPEPVLRARIAERNRSKSDSSEADLGVLEWQLGWMEVPTAEEGAST